MFSIARTSLASSLPTSARQHYLKHGYAIVHDAIDPITALRLREAALESTLKRWQIFSNWPTLDTVLKMESKFTDPVYHITMEQITKRRRLLAYYREMKRQRRHIVKQTRSLLKGRKRDELSGEELWKLSELLASAALTMTGKGCTSTVRNDPEMLSAINKHAVNAWMTHNELFHILQDDRCDVKQPLSTLASFVGGVDKPVIFADAPLLRESFGNPVAFHCTAPSFGVRTNESEQKCNAVTLLIFTYTPSSTKLEPFVLTNSHRFVREQYLHSVSPQRLREDFRPLGIHIPSELKHFHFDETVIATSLLSPNTEQIESCESTTNPDIVDDNMSLEATSEKNDSSSVKNGQCNEDGSSDDVSEKKDDNVNNNTKEQDTIESKEEIHRTNVKVKTSKKKTKKENKQHTTGNNSAEQNDANANSQSRHIQLGSVMIIDPHLMVGFGPNFSKENEVIYRLHIVSESAKAFMRSNSWVDTWRMTPREVNFASPLVFPPLYK